ncbi:adenosine deaminase [Pedococcus cremeus]|uniref:Adenosine deaminase n=1 Tax=Pedococcus cremeus TaxID=587636 RepID=A0A1H9X844_9MICO|nr:adenosine deaminase [Pedococcus cremeus]
MIWGRRDGDGQAQEGGSTADDQTGAGAVAGQQGRGELTLAEKIKQAPKALLHDHLDGGVRPQTILEIADEVGYAALPASDAESLGTWFLESADSGSLERYLKTFDHTLAVMQTTEGLRRVARECVLDLAEDGVVYAESRYAPEQHLEAGLQLEDVIEAVNAGFREGEGLAAEVGHPIRVTALLTAMRHAAKSTEIAELAVRYRDEGVAGFDIAGAEAGFPPTRHLDAFEYLRRENAHFTIHAGEAFGLPSIWEAIQWCGADRLGHGVRIVDDIMVRDRAFGDDVAAAIAAEPGEVHLGRLAAYVRDMRIPLEMCPSSNVQTGAADSVALHPISLLKRLRFRVTVNTDNRLMSGTSMSREMGLLVGEAGWTLEDLRWVTINAMKSAFIPFDERLAIIEEVVKPGYAKLLD